MRAESWRIEINPGEAEIACKPVQRQKSWGLVQYGEQETVHRLLRGYSISLPTVLAHSGFSAIQQQQIVGKLGYLTMPLGIESMPIHDAIRLAELLVEVTIRFTAFLPGQDTILGPIDIAAITRHEGFRWERRKPEFGLTG
ncbi:hypothetical protein H0Z60_04930 [Ectothiorhodospiraceae bacterium WFHF3C12]|nr:hypothetical protein [Ectothiorhodospiraceae bacterium WFHF3C12]